MDLRIGGRVNMAIMIKHATATQPLSVVKPRKSFPIHPDWVSAMSNVYLLFVEDIVLKSAINPPLLYK